MINRLFGASCRRKVPLVLLFVFMMQIHATTLKESALRDRFVDKFAGKLVDRALGAQCRYTNLNPTTLGKAERKNIDGQSSLGAASDSIRDSQRLQPSIFVKSPYRPEEEVDLEGGSYRVVPGSQSFGKVNSLVQAGGTESQSSGKIAMAIRASLLINFVLLIVKTYAFLLSRSLAMLASLVDSTIDLLGQGVLMWTQSLVSSKHQNTEDYPAGRARLEPIGVMVCAVVMGMASIEVISTSIHKLLKYWNKGSEAIYLTVPTTVSIISIVFLKLILYFWCNRVAHTTDNESVRAIAQDNQNDVLSNVAALLGAQMTHIGRKWWMVDPLTGTLISLYIIYTWLRTGYDQVELIVGKKADPEFLKKIQDLVQDNQHMRLDSLCAYHFGPKYLVEVEVVMPEGTPLRESHDAGIVLQHKVESLEEVERCFVHIDYQYRDHDDHDKNVPLKLKLYDAPRPQNPRKHPTIDR
eukprot:gnl/MRDRNA2_/MRDRNA2_34225_c0_seq1.p1 gnl/MRDRNA2_/MRDRNA2_34225_c0~~gnl/MRDRNA2_/MRDRNA2_34225_c0_seq1.p1  ORF type:complete len:467 (+),score=59.75 gnl/MRDRNA2_/MRDRNA2_34225_c0_seq1:99-1499(+)